MTTPPSAAWIRVAAIEDLQAKGVIVVQGSDRPIAVYANDGQVSAVDNRCPHLGFPLHKGSVKDGILTCHWHEGRFDLASGCTFDLWADDVPAYDTRVEAGVVFVRALPRHVATAEHYRRRLHSGMEHDISLVQAKGIIGLMKRGDGSWDRSAWPDLVRQIALFGAANHDAWGEGMTILAIVGNLLPCLSEETAYYTLVRAARQVAADSSGAVPHRRGAPLAGDRHDLATLKRWLRTWVRGRHSDAAERVLLTALARTESAETMTDLVFSAITDRLYADQGHAFDLSNKGFELAERIGWRHATALLPLLVGRMAGARGAEENAHWHHPIELVEPLREAERRTAALMQEGQGKTWRDDGTLGRVLLGDDPLMIIGALSQALAQGAPPTELARHVAYAAALRLARFAMSNEVADWFNPQHTFSYANAVHQALKRSPTPDVVRGVFHGAISVYMDRFLNVPPAKLPGEEKPLDHLPSDAHELIERLLDVLNGRAEVEAAASTIVKYLRLGHPVEPLFDALLYATVREDLDFHPLQVLEAGVQQYHHWQGWPEAEHILVGVVRQLAAFCPTPRAALQTATVALRLHRGDRIYEE